MRKQTIISIFLLIGTIVALCYLVKVNIGIIENSCEKIFQDVDIRDISYHFGNDETVFKAYNPGLSYSPRVDDLYITYRISNFTMCDGVKSKITKMSDVKNFIMIKSDKGNSRKWVDLPQIGMKNDCVKGFEDPRTLIHRNKFYIVANGHSRKNCNTQMFLIEFPLSDLSKNTNSIIPTHVVPLETETSLDATIMQKNWMPFIMNDTIHFIYSVNPHVILQYTKGGLCIKVAETFNNSISPNLRGGSQAQFYDGKFIAFTHIRDGSDKYKTQVYAFAPQPPHQITHISSNFVFASGTDTAHLNIQFVAGFDIIDDKAYITYGEEDCSSKLCMIPMARVLQALKPV